MWAQTWRTSAMSCSTSRMPEPRSATTPVSTLPKLDRLAGVEPGGGLVEEQQVEGPGQDPGQLDQAALPGGEQARLDVGERADAGQLHGLVDRPAHHGRVADGSRSTG